MTIDYQAIEFETAGEALQYYDASGYGDDVILLDGKYYLVRRAEAHRLEAAGAAFDYVHDHEMPDGSHRILTVPVND